MTNSDELCHWKYLSKKKMPDGKWKYYYDNKKNNKVAVGLQNFAYNAGKTIKNVTGIGLKKEIEEAGKQLGEYTRTKNEHAYTARDLRKSVDYARDKKNSVRYKPDTRSVLTKTFLQETIKTGNKEIRKHEQLSDSYERIAKQKQNKVDKLKEQYNRSIAGIAENTINKGKAWLDSLFK